MLLLSEDSAVLKKICKYYSCMSCLFYASTTCLLYFSQLYLISGEFSFTPFYSFITLFQVFQWMTIQVKFEKDFAQFGKRNKGLYSKILCVAYKLTVGQTVKGTLSCCGGAVVYFILAILFGAELFESHEATLMFSILLSILTVLPFCIYVGPNVLGHLVGSKLNSNSFLRLILYNSYGTLLGAWLGAFVIPLDWDRPWQKWPVPCSTGALLGHCVSNIVALGLTFIDVNSAYRKFY